jgi:trigger factor
VAELSGGEQATAEDFQRAVRDDLVEQARRLDELSFEQAAVKAVVEAAEVEVPEALVEREIDRLVEDLERRLGRQGLRLDRYLEYLNQTEAEHREQLRPDAENRIRVDLVLEELGKALDVSPSDDEVDAYMRSEAERDAEMRSGLDDLLRSAVARDFFRHRLTRLKVLEALVARLGGGAPATVAASASGIEAG